jgi:hypothetical protein
MIVCDKNGKPLVIRQWDWDFIEETRKTLASAFPGRTAHQTEASAMAYKNPEAYQEHLLGMRAYGTFIRGVTQQLQYEDKLPLLLEDAAHCFMRAANISAQSGDDLAEAADLSLYADTMLRREAPEKATPVLRELLAIYERIGVANRVLLSGLAALHQSILATLSTKPRTMPLFPDDLVNLMESMSALLLDKEALRAELGTLRQRILPLAAACYEEGYDDAAYRVGQKEIGFSDHERSLGVDDVYDCVCLLIVNPKTGEPALWHIDVSTQDVDFTLNRVLEKIRKGDPNTVPELHVFGARYGGTDFKGHRSMYHKSRYNVARLFDSLVKHHVHLVSLDIFDSTLPASMVYNPKIRSISAKAPGMPDPDGELVHFLPLISSRSSVRTVFDFTQSNERIAVVLDRNAVRHLKTNYLGKTDVEIYELSNDLYRYPYEKIACIIERSIRFSKVYQNELEKLVRILDTHVEQLRNKGITVSQCDRDEAVDALAECPIHLGVMADPMNEPLKQLIANDLFEIDPVSQTARVYVNQLKQFEFSLASVKSVVPGIGSQLGEAAMARNSYLGKQNPGPAMQHGVFRK